jgi:hypothetical protein
MGKIPARVVGSGGNTQIDFRRGDSIIAFTIE